MTRGDGPLSIPDKLKPFVAHGVRFHGTSGNQYYGDCPFSGKENKFYVNPATQLWDSKVTGASGNLPQFLQRIADQNITSMNDVAKQRLIRDRKLPWEAFEGWGIGFDGLWFTIPVYDISGRLVDLRRWKPTKNIQTTPTMHPGLLNAPSLKNAKGPVYLCEGEWDAIAMAWLLKRSKKSGVVAGVPGAGVFRTDWVPWFANRDVIVLYDNDEAGEQGELRIQKFLKGTARSLQFIHWPANLPSGFDVRDWVVHGLTVKNNVKGCYANLAKLYHNDTRQQNQDSSVSDTDEPTTYASFNEVARTFKKWLFLKDTAAIEIVLATALSHHIDGDPVWLFLVAPPGGSKTETLTALSRYKETYLTSSLTPHSLISGFPTANGRDPSLIPRLDGKILVIKDFTSILSMRDMEKDEIFGILRDAYDGKCSKTFGNGIVRSYSSRFTIVAAVTPRVYDLAGDHQSLGERFLKFCIGDSLEHVSENDIIIKAIANVNSEHEMRDELQSVVRNFLVTHVPRSLPELSSAMISKIVELAKFGARLRGTVSRDRFRSDMIMSRPSAEVGSRLGKQLAKMAISIAMVHEKEAVSDYEYNLVKKIMLDTIPQRTEDVIKYIWAACPSEDDDRSTREIAEDTRYPHVTVARVMADLHLLDVVRKSGSHNSFRWALSPYIRNCINGASLYTSEIELNRPKMRAFITVRKPQRRPHAASKRVVGSSPSGSAS